MTGRDWASEAGIPRRADGGTDWAAAAGLTPGPVNGSDDLNARDRATFQAALAKKKAGKPLTKEEAQALARMEAGRKTLAGIGVALQPFQVLSDLTKGLIGEAKGIPGAANRGAGAAAGHLTYGLAEYLPGATGARARGVSGEELLKGTKYEGNATAALAVELLADPSILLAGAGLIAKGGATAGRLASLEKVGKTAEGRALIQNALRAADARGDVLLRASDEITGVPAAARAVAAGPVGKAVKATAARVADTRLPDNAPIIQPFFNAVKREGGATYGDAFLTPDQKVSVYPPARLEIENFRDGTRLGVDDLARDINQAAVPDVRVVADLTRGLGKTDARETVRLLGVFTGTTDPKVAAEALRKLTLIGQRTGKNLEKPFVAAVKSSDNIGQNILGPELKAQNLPVVLDPVVTKAIQEAETGADLLPLIGKYTTADGRPRGIAMTQYAGRAEVDKTIQAIKDGPEIPAIARVDEDNTAATLTGVIEDLPPPPPRPIEPVGVAPKAAPPLNAGGLAARVTDAPVTVTAPWQSAAPPITPRSPAEVLEELFGGSKAAPAPAAPAAPVNVIPTDFTPPARPPAAVMDELLSPSLGAQASPPPPLSIADEMYIPWAEAGQARWTQAGRAGADELRAYIGGAYRAINDTLRGTYDEASGLYSHTPAQAAEYVAGLDRMMENFVLPQPLTVYRGASPASDLTTTLRQAFNQGQLTPGSAFPQEGFLSTTTSRAAVEQFSHGKGVELTLQLPQGLKAAPLGRYGLGGEYEVLVNRGQTLIVTGAAENAAGALQITARIEPGAGPAAQSGGLAARLGEALGQPLSQTKTPASVLQDLLAPARDPFTALPSPAITRTPQDDVRRVALPEAPPERMVERAVPTTYRTLDVEANALDWGALPDNASRRSVLNSIEGAGNAKFITDASGATRLDRANIRVPLSHPEISRYFDDQTLLAAQRPGTEILERTIVRRQMVPDWYNPRDPAPLEVQRGLRAQAQQEAAEQAFPNDLKGMLRDDEPFDALAPWVLGDTFVSFERLNPATLSTRAAANDYARRVQALAGRPPTKGEVFQYRLALARYRQASNLRTLNTTDAARHMAEFVRENPEATLLDAAASVARAFDLGTAGAKFVRQELARAESGWTRQMSKLERLEFAGKIKQRDAARGQPAPGGMLMQRLLRRPDDVSAEFRQVFPQEENALKVLDEQIRTRTAAIVRAQMFREYHGKLREGGMHVTAREIREMQAMNPAQLDPRLRRLREDIAGATELPGVPAGWKVMDRTTGPFEKGDAVPWWAYQDLFGASGVDDAAVSARILSKGGLGEVYDRAWRSMNAQMLGAPTSVINDQIGQMLQMGLWGVTPDAVIEGMIRRASATPEQLAVMRKSGIQGTTLESSVSQDRAALTRLAERLDGDTDTTRMGRVVDTLLRFRERGTGLDPQAMTGVAGVAADVAHLGSGYVFQLRSRMSDLQREALYFHRLQLGDAPAQAAAWANQVLMDMRLVPAYARVVSRYWPFFNWIAMSGPRSVVTVLRKPGVNAAYQRTAGASDSDDPKDAARRVLARDGGYFNLGIDERGGTRLYLDPRNWDPTNTIPQLLDFSGTKVGAVSLPWWATTIVALQWGTDRFGGNIYAEVLDGQRGGATEAFKIDRVASAKIAAKFLYQQFQPSYAPGSSRAKALVSAVLQTAKLPDDGSRDVTIARALAGSPQGRAFLTYMQNGNFAVIERDLKGNRGSPYMDAPPSVARAAGAFLLPLRGVNADQDVQGTAQQKLSVEMLNFSGWLRGERKKLAELEASGATPERLREVEDRVAREANRRGGRVGYLDQITR